MTLFCFYVCGRTRTLVPTGTCTATNSIASPPVFFPTRVPLRPCRRLRRSRPGDLRPLPDGLCGGQGEDVQDDGVQGANGRTGAKVCKAKCLNCNAVLQKITRTHQKIKTIKFRKPISLFFLSFRSSIQPFFYFFFIFSVCEQTLFAYADILCS